MVCFLRPMVNPIGGVDSLFLFQHLMFASHSSKSMWIANLYCCSSCLLWFPAELYFCRPSIRSTLSGIDVCKYGVFHIEKRLVTYGAVCHAAPALY